VVCLTFMPPCLQRPRMALTRALGLLFVDFSWAPLQLSASFAVTTFQSTGFVFSCGNRPGSRCAFSSKETRGRLSGINYESFRMGITEWTSSTSGTFFDGAAYGPRSPRTTGWSPKGYQWGPAVHKVWKTATAVRRAGKDEDARRLRS